MQLKNSYFGVSKLHTLNQISNEILSYLTLGIVVAGFLISSNVDLLTSIRTTVVLITISSTGLIIWLAVLRSERPIYFPEAVGMGLALGFIACTYLMLFLKPVGVDYYGAVIPIVALHIVLFSQQVRKFLNTSRLRFLPQDNAVILFAVFFGLYLNTPILLIPAILFLVIARPQSGTTIFHSIGKTYIFLWVVIILILLYLSITSRFPEPFIFGQGAEPLPRQAWSNSIMMWGPNENIAIFGNPLRYHWFSFAVFGMIARLSGLMPMVWFYSGLSGVIDLICVGGIIWSTSFLHSKDRNVALLSVVIAFGAVSLNMPFAIITDSSPDATSWLIWVVAFGFALLNRQDLFRRAAPIFFAAIGTAVILSNGGYGTSLAIGLSFWLIGVIFSDKKFAIRSSLNQVSIFACTGIAMSVAYLLFLTPSKYSTSTIDLSLRFLTSWNGFLFVISFYSSRIIPLPFLLKNVSKPFKDFLYGLVVASVFGFFIYRNSSWQLAIYFTFPALLLFSTPLAMAFKDGWSQWQYSFRTRHLLVFSSLTLGFLLQVLFSAVQWKHYERFNTLVLSEYLVIVPIITILIALALFTQLSKSIIGLPKKFTRRYRNIFGQIFIMSTIACGLGLGLGYSVRTYTRDLVDLQSGKHISKEVSPVVSYELQAAMVWLNTNSTKVDLVATNFLCGTDVRSFFQNCAIKNNHLAIAAYAQRRVLIEGNSWSNVGTAFNKTHRLPVPITGEGIFTLQVVAPQWMTERIAMSHRFATQPDIIAAEYMQEMGITWFVVDKTKQIPTSWSPYATIAFENSEVIILKTNF